MSDNKPSPPEIVAEFIAEHRIACRHGTYHRHTGTHWEPLTTAQMRHMVATWIMGRHGLITATPQMVSQVVATIADIMTIGGEHQPFWASTPGEVASVLNVANGILDLTPLYQGGEPALVPHSPDLFTTSCCDYPYDPVARCEKFDQFMAWMTCGDPEVERMLLEFAAYCLLRRLDLQRLLVLVGSGSNGKSVWLKALTRIIGSANTSAVPIERLGGFGLSELSDKYANICGDANEVTKVQEGCLKMLADGSEQTFERKGVDAYKSRCQARLIFAANQMPRFRDRTDGIWRRLLVIPCNAKTSGPVVRSLEDHFNYSGILNRIIQAGRDLIARGDFAVPAVVEQAIDAERIEANPARQFILAHVRVAAGRFCESDELYREYRGWAVERGYMQLASNTFGRELRACFASEIRSGTVKPGKSTRTPRKNGYQGLQFIRDGLDALSQAEEVASA